MPEEWPSQELDAVAVAKIGEEMGKGYSHHLKAPYTFNSRRILRTLNHAEVLAPKMKTARMSKT